MTTTTEHVAEHLVESVVVRLGTETIRIHRSIGGGGEGRWYLDLGLGWPRGITQWTYDKREYANVEDAYAIAEAVLRAMAEHEAAVGKANASLQVTIDRAFFVVGAR